MDTHRGVEQISWTRTTAKIAVEEKHFKERTKVVFPRVQGTGGPAGQDLRQGRHPGREGSGPDALSAGALGEAGGRASGLRRRAASG